MANSQDVLTKLLDARNSLHDAAKLIATSHIGSRAENLTYIGEAIGTVQRVESNIGNGSISKPD